MDLHGLDINVVTKFGESQPLFLQNNFLFYTSLSPLCPRALIPPKLDLWVLREGSLKLTNFSSVVSYCLSEWMTFIGLS